MSAVSEPPVDGARHWDLVYQSRRDDQLTWDQDQPDRSLRLIQEYAPSLTSCILDAGAGRSRLVDHLLRLGYRSLVLIDLSEVALNEVCHRLGADASHVQFLAGDITAMKPIPEVDVWHDRAVFHFLTTAEDRIEYVTLASHSVRKTGVVILAAFANDGPAQCSGLPVCRYDASEIAREFHPDFTLVHHERVLHPTPGGGAQPFVYVVLKRV